MQALKSQFSQAGIQVNLSSAPFDTIISLLAPCKSTQASVLVADAELRRRLDLRRGPVPDR